MSTADTPPTLFEIREVLRELASEAGSARKIFAGRLEPDPGGSSWGWDNLRRKIRNALEDMESGAWTDFKVEVWIPANSIAEAVAELAEPVPVDVQEAAFLYGMMKDAIAAADVLVYGFNNLPGGGSDAFYDSDFSNRVLAKRDVLKAIRARMEAEADKRDHPHRYEDPEDDPR